MLKSILAAVALASMATASAAWADDPPAPDKSAYTVFNPTPDSLLRGLCTDRPTKSTSPCTVDAGHWQVESDIYNITVDRSGGVTTTTQLFTNPTLKLGLTNSVDFEINISPYEQVSVSDHGKTESADGVGDLYLRLKASLLGDDGGNIGVALSPYLKVPTAPSPIGNGAVEGGLIVPVSINLPKNWSLVIDPEADVLANEVGGGRHVNTSGLLSFSYPATKAITLSVELWGDANFDPTGTVTQVSADLGAAWIPPAAPDLQFDGGVNLGLNKATPGVQAYLGISHRF